MIDNSEILKAGRFIKEHCKADDFVFSVWSKDSHQTRFAQNAITQHIGGENLTVNLETAFGKRTGSASVNQIDDNSLMNLIDTAEATAKLNQSDPEFVPSEPSSALKDVKNFAESVEKLGVDDMVLNISRCVENAKSKNAKVSGMSEKHIGGFFVCTKNGFEGFDRFSEYGHSMTMAGESRETKVSLSVKDYSSFSMDNMIELLNSQFDALRKPEPFQKGRIPVILRPAAVNEFFGFLHWMMDRRNADEGVSAFTDQIDQKFFGDRFTMSSTMDDPELNAMRFSPEGIPSETTRWVDKGYVRNLPVSRYWAREKGVKPIRAFNVFIEGGDASEQEMMKAAGRGLIINHFWYIRFVDMKRGELTGLTRDGVLYFEDGQIKHPVVNLRFNEIPHEATRRILQLGKSVLQDTTSKVPSMLIEDFNFVDTTTF